MFLLFKIGWIRSCPLLDSFFVFLLTRSVTQEGAGALFCPSIWSHGLLPLSFSCCSLSLLHMALYLGTFDGWQTLRKLVAQSKSWDICTNREQGGLRGVRGGKFDVFTGRRLSSVMKGSLIHPLYLQESIVCCLVAVRRTALAPMEDSSPSPSCRAAATSPLSKDRGITTQTAKKKKTKKKLSKTAHAALS